MGLICRSDVTSQQGTPCKTSVLFCFCFILFFFLVELIFIVLWLNVSFKCANNLLDFSSAYIESPHKNLPPPFSHLNILTLLFVSLLHWKNFHCLLDIPPRPDLDLTTQWPLHVLSVQSRHGLLTHLYSPIDQSQVIVRSQQEDVRIPLLSWQEVSLLKGLLGNVFLLPFFSFSPPLTSSDKLVINMAAILPNRPFFVNS